VLLVVLHVIYCTTNIARCGSSPLSSLKLLPQGCTLTYPDGTSQSGPEMFDTGSCSNLLCQANNSYCSEGDRCCCQVFTTATAIMECSDGVMTELIVTSCGCRRCNSSILVPFSGTVQASSSIPIQAAEVVIDGRTNLMTDINGMFSFSVPSTHASVTIAVTATGYLPFNDTYDVSPGENNDLIISLVKLAVSRPVTLSQQSVLLINGEDATSSNSTTALSRNSSSEMLNAVADSGNVFVGISSDAIRRNNDDDLVVMVQSTFINFSDPSSFDLLATDDLSTPAVDNNTNETVLMPIEALSAGLINVQDEVGETILEESDVELNTALDSQDANITDPNAQIGVYQVNDASGQYERLDANVSTENFDVAELSSKRRRQAVSRTLQLIIIRVRIRLSIVFVIAFIPPPMMTCHAAVLVVQDNGGVDEVVEGVDVQLDQQPNGRRFISRTEISPACVVISCTGSLVVHARRNGRSLSPPSYTVDVPKSINLTVFTSLDECQSTGLSLNNLQKVSAFVFRDDPLPVVTNVTPTTATPPLQQFCVMRLSVISCMHLDVEVATVNIDDTSSLTIMRPNQTITEYQSGFTCNDMRTSCIEISCTQLTTVNAVYMKGGAIGDAEDCSLTLVSVPTGSPLGGNQFTFRPSADTKGIFEGSSLNNAMQTCEGSLNSAAHFECVEKV